MLAAHHIVNRTIYGSVTHQTQPWQLKVTSLAWLRAGIVALLLLLVLGMSGCSIFKKGTKGGGYYQNDGPGEPGKMSSDNFKDAVPRNDPLLSGPNKPYVVFGKRYVPDTREVPYKKRGIASWYGKQFHGRKTSSGEVYDMYAMTAAHTTLPIPSYVKVTSVKNGRSVIVRVNDRGPFNDKRLIDLSYGAAYRLGFIEQGTGEVIVERIMPADITAGRIPTASNTSSSNSSVVTPPTTGGSLSGGFFIQVGAYGEQINAHNIRDRLSSQNRDLRTLLRVNYEGGLYKVYAGPYQTESQAQSASSQIQQQTGAGTLILDRR